MAAVEIGTTSILRNTLCLSQSYEPKILFIPTYFVYLGLETNTMVMTKLNEHILDKLVFSSIS